MSNILGVHLVIHREVTFHPPVLNISDSQWWIQDFQKWGGGGGGA